MAKKNVRQAVVIIHGMGEQIPMDTMRAFVEFVISESDPKARKPRQWFKPEDISSIEDQRRIRISQSRTRPPTDFYELYWAHLIGSTTWKHIYNWIFRLLFANPTRFTSRLLWIWIISWLSLIGFLIAFYLGAISLEDFNLGLRRDSILNFVVSLILLGITAGLQYFLIRYLGDAARYLHGNPENVKMRNDILRQGVSFFKELHEDGRYDRIVVVAHSLGTVVGYDILSTLWGDYYKKHGSPSQVEQPELEKLLSYSQSLTEEAQSDDVYRFQKFQEGLWVEERKHGKPWLITDFITLGSPLAHATALMSKGKEDLKTRQKYRLYPVCPPLPEEGDKMYFNQLYDLPKNAGKRTVKTLHAGALFGPVRWTNIYFPGDFIGGPLRRVFGHGIRDIRATMNNGSWKSYLPGYPHTQYWRKRPFASRQEVLKPKSAQKQLITALRLDSRKVLRKI